MTRKIKIAAVQMDANPTPTAARLARADKLVIQASQADADLIVLPELFNTGYAYAEANFQLAEQIDGMTSTWMKETAARLNIHLAGSLMLLEKGEIYNALLLFSPAGQMWRYDKRYPWAWERGYFRERKDSMTVAHTELGDLGMLICWDVGHSPLWKQYAGQVDAMVIASCPPDGTNPTYHFPDGNQITFDNLGPVIAALKGSGDRVFGDMINQQTAWLGVPCVNSVGSGKIKTSVPRGFASLLSMIPLAPWNAKYLPQADRLQMSCSMIDACKIVSAEGQVLAERTQDEGEGFTITEVTLPDVKPSPRGAQPSSPLGWFAYFSVDILIPFLMRSVYNKGIRRISGRVQ